AALHPGGPPRPDPAREGQRRLRVLRPLGRLHRLPGAAAPVPHLAVLGQQRRQPGGVAEDVRGLPGRRQGRADPGRGDPAARAGDPVVARGRGVSEATRRKVLELYAEVDREVAAAGPVCVASGRCCRFKEYGHVLYLSSLEAEVLLAGAPPYERPVGAGFFPLPKGHPCTAPQPPPPRVRRYSRAPNYPETAGRLTEKYLRRLKELAEQEGRGWHYAPLHHFLNHPEDAAP